MTETAPRPRTRLKTLKEALKERLSPEEWSAIFEREPGPRSRPPRDRPKD